MKNILRKVCFTLCVISTFGVLDSKATDIIWDFSDRPAQSFSNGTSYSFTANDGVTEMRYSAGSSDAIVAKSGTKDGYLKENGATGSGTVYDLDGTTNIKKNRLIRLYVSGSGTLTISCSNNIGKYKIFDGSATGTSLDAAYTANTTSGTLTPTSGLLWIETTTKGYITQIKWSPSGPATPVAVTGVSLNKTSTSIEQGQDEQLTATVAPSNADDKSVTWSSSDASVASVDQTGKVTANAQGTATITVTTTDGGKTATCQVTVTAPAPPTAVTGISLNKSTASISAGTTETLTVTYTPTNANSGKAITWTSNNPAVATVNNGVVNGVAEGTATITATSEGGFTASCTVTVTAASSVPSTNLTLHVPEKYEAIELAGGYNTPLTYVGGREYEVYYTEQTPSGGFPTFSTTPAAECKADGISGSTTTTKNVGREGDKWFEGTVYSHSECKAATSEDEFVFATKTIREHRLGESDTYQFHVKGFDQFSLWGMDKKLDPKNGDQIFVVKIDGVEQPIDASLYNTTAYTIRRYPMTTGEHLIEISTTCSGSNVCYMGGFSLRVAQEPRTKWLKGNDSTQVIYQTAAIRPVTYVTKYNNIAGAETRLEWDGPVGTGLALTKIEGSLSDTLLLSGVANCPVGVYHYNVVSYHNNIETTRVPGSFIVKSSIKAASVLNIDAYVNEDIEEPVVFHYYALSADNVRLTWTQTVPAGITGSGNNGTYTISGRPTAVGTYPYSITVDGADTTLTGTVVVRELNMGNNPIMYLYKNNLSYENDPVYQYLTSAAGGNKNLVARKARTEGLRTPDQYAQYKWILISEDADADNAEVLAIVRGGVNVPVLNLQGFTYSPDRLGWGYPDNGTVDTITHNGCNIFVQRNDHPIFSRFNLKVGDKLSVFDKVERNGIMPIAISGEAMQNTLCLATGYTRNIEDYDQDGELQTAIHEIPAAMRGGKKYICMPMAIGAGNKLSIQGKALLDAIVSYLLDENSPTFIAPTLRIDRFSIAGVDGIINDAENTITVTIDTTQITDLDLTAVKPSITLADPTYTHVTPAIGEEVDLQYSSFLPAKFIVSDYISSRVYFVTVRQYAPQGLEDVYEAGQWVNVFDIYGRKIATTNEDIYQMELPHGVYLIITENGQTIKLMR